MKVISMKEAASLLGVSTVTFWRMRKDFPLKTIVISRREMVEVGDLKAWVMDQNRRIAIDKKRGVY